MERRTRRGWLLLGGGVLIAIIGAGAAVHRAWDDLDESMCGNELLHENVSPDGKMKVVVFQRDCGATTGFSTQASIIPAGDALPKKSGDVFVADTGHGAAPVGEGGGPELRVQWLSNERVVLSHHVAARVFKADAKHDEVDVVFELFR